MNKWHAPGIGEVHNADHTQMIYCTDGEQVADDALAGRVCRALLAINQIAALAPVEVETPDGLHWHCRHCGYEWVDVPRHPYLIAAGEAHHMDCAYAIATSVPHERPE